jgi:ATP-dependent helicase HrpB
MPDLPINDVLAEIKTKLDSHNRVVLQAPPGAGKTTAVPLALLDQPWLQNKQIIMLEPRRLAARNAAARMAFLLDEKIGKTIGYQIRQDNCFSDKTKILVVTEGILTRKLQADPELKNIALVIFDEFHERSLHADLSLALCLQSQQILREDLKLLVMSATLNTSAISALLDNAPVIQSEGRSYPVDIHYLDRAIKQSDQRQLVSQILHTVEKVIRSQHGNCLVFLPGVREINQLAKQIGQHLQDESISNILIAPLHGSLNKQQQDQAITAPTGKTRKIVLATNIAETSLTIDGINCVIDSGLERILQYDASSAMNTLKTQAISKDSTEQRSGRAGRLSAGTCYRLWTAAQQQRLADHSVAEILHSDLSSLTLELANWGVQHSDELCWLDMPPSSAIEQAKTLLRQLGATDELGKITRDGRDMLKLGTHPRLAHMMLNAAKLGQAYHACIIAGILSEKDILQANTDKSYDLHERINILQDIRDSKIKDHHGIDLAQCKRVLQTADDFFRRVKQFIKHPSLKDTAKKQLDDRLSGVLLAYAYPDRIAKQRNHNEARYLLSNGKGASIPAYLQHHLYQYLVIASLDAKQGQSGNGSSWNHNSNQSEASIYLAAEISAEQLEKYFIDEIHHTETIEWNETQQRVEAKQVTGIGKIILQEQLVSPENKQAIHHCLLKAIKDKGLQCLNWTPQASNLQQRVQFININIENNRSLKAQLNTSDLPDFSEQALVDSMSSWLAPHLKDENSIKHCRKLDLYKLLLNRLSWEQQKLVDRLAPEKITVPSGSAIRIDYSDPLAPVLAVRLQEVFGLHETPALLDGHSKVMMHLLSPAHRPMQVTQDLHNFWESTYHEVKKELRGKYKKHYWPDDPLTAQATSKTKKQMNR